MTTKTISAYKARINFGQLIDDVRYNKVPYLVEKNGRPAVAIIDAADFERLQKKVVWPTRLYSNKEIQEFLKEDKIRTK